MVVINLTGHPVDKWRYLLESLVHNNRLMENTYTDDEVRDMLTDIADIISSEIESELINSSHTNVLVLQQVFAQAQKWHLDLDADLAELENRGQFDVAC